MACLALPKVSLQALCHSCCPPGQPKMAWNNAVSRATVLPICEMLKVGLAGASAFPRCICAYGPIGAVGFVGKKKSCELP